ncbi:nuclear transport factor 2 family protein [Chitinimonas koreensis]|nr:nuclear transport factor 2 family protein [Chitinimonas koreensis]
MPSARADDAAEVGKVLDRLHAAAAAAQFERYFELFAPDGVFIGTDASERWTVPQFKAYARPHFDQGRGWTYTVVERHLNLPAGGRHASFDELLDNAGLGRCRGTGVLRKIGGQWKIEQYHLTVPLPNALADQVAKLIRAEQAPKDPPARP